MIRIIIASLFLVSTAQAQAVVQVRTGEHEDFTRVVLDFQARSDWRLGRVSESTYELRLKRKNSVRFETSKAFRRIRRERLVDLENLPRLSGLRFELGCECSLRVTEWPNNWLVIDIRDVPPKTGDPYAQPFADEESRRTEPSLGDLPLFPTRNREPLLLLGTEPNSSGDRLHQRVDDTKRTLVRQFARAAAQGIIAADPAPEVTAGKRLRTNDSPNLAANLRAVTRLDKDLADASTSLQADDDCLAPHMLDPSNWPDERDDVNPAELFSADGEPNKEEHLRRAQQLLRMTFGAEAAAVLDHVPLESPSARALRDVAVLMDGPSGQARALSGQEGCDSVVALWAVLSGSDESPPASDVIVASFSDFPTAMRRHLGVRLARRLLDLGEQEAARAVKNGIERLSAPREAVMLDVELSDETDTAAPAEEDLLRIALSGAEEAPEALLKLIERRIAAGAEVGLTLTDETATLAFQLDDQPIADDLRVAEVRALIQDGRYSSALSRVIALDPALTQERGLATALIRAVTERADDADFVSLISRLDQLPEIASAARVAAAERLLALDLPDLALDAIRGPKVPMREKERLLRGRIALALDQYRVAASYLAGLSGDEPRALLRQAEEALSVEAINDAPEKLPTSQVQPKPGPLARSRALLESASDLRQDLESSLQLQ